MKINYDLIIIGLNESAISAAEYALNLGARVAIIYNSNFSFLSKNIILDLNIDRLRLIDNILSQEVKKINCKIENLKLAGLDIFSKESVSSFSQTNRKIKVSMGKYTFSSPVAIITDILSQNLEFTYSLKTNKVNIYENFSDLKNILNSAIASVTIKGSNLEAIYLAQQLTSLNKSIILPIKNKQLLPTEDKDISWKLQLILEAKGIKICNANADKLETNQNISNENNFIINTEKNISYDDYQDLGNDLGLKWQGYNILANERLQTHNSKIYACGEILGGYTLDNLNQYEAKIAVDNSLFFPLKKVDYENISYSLNTNPRIHRIGYTEKQALQLYHNNFYIIKLDVNFNYHHYSSFIKLIISNDNLILGFHGLGKNLEELFIVIKNIKQNRYSINYLFKENFNNIYTYKIANQIKEKFLEKEKKQNNIIMGIRETFLLYKRS
ncbi:FAD-dependent oxidoreductase [Cyanobacterium sp. DS4]|uniref:FAD-dependent oxidoreductase n=1 Tax=Cyanobacterium sp. DS4 TaxID=2878255 RepID=UPI002E81AD5F|nr:FAD-dependent oxidoreductase [Cyanobacterium sp. Dongsha4]WVK99516.1 FAD-dependent oxidoreductase [Cyanobacterium sp. Dongsha4]